MMNDKQDPAADLQNQTFVLNHETGTGAAFSAATLFAVMVMFSLLKIRHAGPVTSIAVMGGFAFILVATAIRKKQTVFSASPPKMRQETRILGKLVFRENIDISNVKWIRSGLTNSGVYLELGVSNWTTIQLIWVPLTSNQVEFGRRTYQVMFDGIRTSVAQFLNIEDLGWARYT